jgi:DNA-binding transcriptional ArsR family regulator
MNKETVSQEVFYAIADPIRRAILQELIDGGKSVNEIAEPFPVSRPAISKHLRILLESNLVTEHKAGRQHIYNLNPESLRSVDGWLQHYRRFWTTNLTNLKNHIEHKGEQR